jgi:adenylyltransferase/sulfurtransferase
VPVLVRIPAPLRSAAGDHVELRGEGATIGQVLADLGRSWPRIGSRVLDADGGVAGHVRVLLNGEEVHAGDEMDAPVAEGDRVDLVPAIAGGAPLSEDLIGRYARQLLVPGIGEAGQERLLSARVRVVGAGPIAGPALIYLVQAGVGRIWLEDPEPVGAADLGGWLHPPAAIGSPRVSSAQAALAGRSRYVSVEPYPTGGVPSAALVCAASQGEALAVAEVARRAGIPHVVVETDGEGGVVISIPPGAPCYQCAHSSGAGRPPTAATAALGALAALELIHLIADPADAGGRRIDLLRGVPSARGTVRIPGCACGGSGGTSTSGA